MDLTKRRSRPSPPRSTIYAGTWAQHLISRRSPCPQHTTTIIEPAHCGSKGQSRSAQKLSGLSGGSSSRQPRSAKPNPTAPTRRTSPRVAPQATRSGSGRATAEAQRCCRRHYYAATITAAAGGGAATGLTRWLLAAHSPRPASTRSLVRRHDRSARSRAFAHARMPPAAL